MSLQKTAWFLHLLLHLISCNKLFWVKCMNEIQFQKTVKLLKSIKCFQIISDVLNIRPTLNKWWFLKGYLQCRVWTLINEHFILLPVKKCTGISLILNRSFNTRLYNILKILIHWVMLFFQMQTPFLFNIKNYICLKHHQSLQKNL